MGIKFHPTLLSTSFRSSRSEFAAQTRCIEPTWFDQMPNLHDFMQEKSFCKTGWLWMYGALIA
jgi:hypothetical protein